MNICPSSLAGVILFPRDSKKLFYRSLRTLFPALKLSLHFFTRYTLFVKSRASRITAALILLTCVVSPFIVAEFSFLFDPASEQIPLVLKSFFGDYAAWGSRVSP